MDTENKVANTKSELYERIIATAMNAFIKEGIKPVKMDDIANNLSISKRTLYETFKDKEELLFECVKRRQQQTREYMLSIYEKSNNILEVIFEFYFRHLENLRQVNYRFFEDIKKYPNVLGHMKKERDNNQKATVQFFQKGVEQGLFKDDLDMNIVIQLMNSQSDQLIKDDLGRIYPLDEIFKTLILIYIRGISTEKGNQILDELITEYENKIKLNQK